MLEEHVRRLLIVDDEENMRHMLSEMLKRTDYHVDSVADGEAGLKRITEHFFEIVLCDVKMPKLDGLAFLQKGAAHLADSTVIMMSAYGTIDLAVEAMKRGAYDFISKPFKGDEIRIVIEKAEERERLKRENRYLKEKVRRIEARHGFSTMVGKSTAIQAILKIAAKVAKYNTTVLLIGESGTGKELVARGIHELSDRKTHPLIPVNCAGIPENLLESELFGHVKGAYTGADKDKKGLFLEADRGTIFLDEIGEMPMNLQVKLLRVLQENELRPIGGAQTRHIDVRVIAATSKDLEKEIRIGNFREDLFYRLNVMPLHLPPLRDRKEDVPSLCRHFIDKFMKSHKCRIDGISTSAMTLLLDYHWPGNVRELENVIERAMILTEGRMLSPECFPPEIGRMPAALGGRHRGEEILRHDSLKAAQKLLEKEMIIKALHKTAGNRTQAARLLEISHPSLLAKIKAYHIDL